jgi:hypothetical protein
MLLTQNNFAERKYQLLVYPFDIAYSQRMSFTFWVNILGCESPEKSAMRGRRIARQAPKRTYSRRIKRDFYTSRHLNITATLIPQYDPCNSFPADRISMLDRRRIVHHRTRVVKTDPAKSENDVVNSDPVRFI